MCNNSLIYLVTPTLASILADGILPLSTIARRRSSAIQQSNDSILLNAPGYYKVSLNITFTAPAAGDVTVELRQDGVAVPGATATETITTATTEVRTISFDVIVRVPCCGAPSTLTFVNTGVAISSSNIAVNVEYLD